MSQISQLKRFSVLRFVPHLLQFVALPVVSLLAGAFSEGSVDSLWAIATFDPSLVCFFVLLLAAWFFYFLLLAIFPVVRELFVSIPVVTGSVDIHVLIFKLDRAWYDV